MMFITLSFDDDKKGGMGECFFLPPKDTIVKN